MADSTSAAGGTFDAASAERLQLTISGRAIAAAAASAENPSLARLVMSFSCSGGPTLVQCSDEWSFVESAFVCCQTSPRLREKGDCHAPSLLAARRHHAGSRFACLRRA